jgi:hypothetical protein
MQRKLLGKVERVRVLAFPEQVVGAGGEKAYCKKIGW